MASTRPIHTRDRLSCFMLFRTKYLRELQKSMWFFPMVFNENPTHFIPSPKIIFLETIDKIISLLIINDSNDKQK